MSVQTVNRDSCMPEDIEKYKTILQLIEKLNNSLRLIVQFAALKREYDKANPARAEKIKMQSLEFCKIATSDSTNITLYIDQPPITIRAVENKVYGLKNTQVRKANEYVSRLPQLASIRLSSQTAAVAAAAADISDKKKKKKKPVTSSTATTTKVEVVQKATAAAAAAATSAALSEAKRAAEEKLLNTMRENEAQRCIVNFLAKRGVQAIDFLVQPNHPLRIYVYAEAERVYAQTGGSLLHAANHAEVVLENEVKKVIRRDLEFILMSRGLADIGIDDRCVEFLYEARLCLIDKLTLSTKRKSADSADSAELIRDKVKKWAFTDLARLGHEGFG
jgi:hypothetical protein